MLPFSPPTSNQQQVPTQNLRDFRFTRAALVLALSVVIAASCIVMVGPQITVIVPVALILGVCFAVQRSYGAMICFGYPLTFGLISAWIGCNEMSGYQLTLDFFISMGCGLIGYALIALGLWKTLPGGKS